MKISKIKPNPNNPRIIKDDAFRKLCNSINKFPKMMELRPIIVDHNNIIVGGNMRHKALLELGYTDIPDEWVKQAKDFTKEELKEFIIKDNVGFGEWDYDLLANEWNIEELNEWGLEIDFIEETEKEKPAVKFSEFIGEQNNYVVLIFKTEIDWLNAQSHFNLESVSSKRQNGKEWSIGIGRVVDGAKYLTEISGKQL